ncbi:MAG TPA: TetR/AcrR family transcriptional regulator [Mycobacteriales bacterium]|nr:TetR/AcrR family transcriptional regulator [Mycobacteriales bacterium]
MTSSRRLGAEDSATRTALLDAAIALMLEEGYASVTSRKVAARAGLKPQLVHYYFATMDDLFLALVRRGAQVNLERQVQALASAQPLRALWAFSNDPASATLTWEFAALGNHRKAIRAELAGYAEQFRALQTEALARILAGYGVAAEEIAAEVLPVLLTGLSQILAMEETLGLTSGHPQMRAKIEQWIERFEPSGVDGTVSPPSRLESSRAVASP